MLEPDDVACQTIDDEFSIGEEIIVAPVLQKGATNREGIIFINRLTVINT